MIIRELYFITEDNIKLYRSYSDNNVMIQKEGTNEIYTEAVDIESNHFTYIETDIPIEIIDEVNNENDEN